MYSYLFFSLFKASRSDYNAQYINIWKPKPSSLADDGVHDITWSWWVPSLIFKIWPTSIRIYITPVLNLRPGLNLAAFFTYIQKSPALKLVSFMAYTYNIWGWWDGTRWHWPSAQSNFWILAHFYQDLCNSCIKSEARTEFSGLFYKYTKISSFQTGLLHGLHW